MLESMAALEKIQYDEDPDRCQAVFDGGQCRHKRFPPSKYCPMHGGHAHAAQSAKKDARLYLAALYKDRIGEHADHPKIKTLREEVGILRITLDNVLGRCRDEKDMLLHTSRIVELAREIGKLVTSTTKLEQVMAHVLDKNQALAWIQEILELISTEISDPDTLQKLATKMIESLEKRTS